MRQIVLFALTPGWLGLSYVSVHPSTISPHDPQTACGSAPGFPDRPGLQRCHEAKQRLPHLHPRRLPIPARLLLKDGRYKVSGTFAQLSVVQLETQISKACPKRFCQIGQGKISKSWVTGVSGRMSVDHRTIFFHRELDRPFNLFRAQLAAYPEMQVDACKCIRRVAQLVAAADHLQIKVRLALFIQDFDHIISRTGGSRHEQ